MDKIRDYFENAKSKNTQKGFYAMLVMISIAACMVGWIFYDMATR